MRNKEVEKMFNSIKVEYALLEGKLYYQSKDVEKFLEDNQSLTEQVHDLKQEVKQLEKQNKIYNDYFDDLTELFDGHEFKDNVVLLDDIRNLLMNMLYKVSEVKDNG